MRSGWISGACGLACAVWLAACGSSSSDEAAPTGPVGEAVQVTGSVSVVHEGAEQPLAVGGKVFGADEIVTGADGAVTIRLFHNEARWTLESGKRKRVDASLAWSAPAQAGGGVLAGNDTSESTAAAGRHAEKEAADTRATAALLAERESSQAEAARAATPPPVTAPAPTPRPEPPPPPAPGPTKTRTTAVAPKKIVTLEERTLDSDDIGVQIGPTGGAGKPDPARLSDDSDADAVARAMRPHHKAFQACYKNALKIDPDLSGRIVLEFVVEADGSVRLVASKPSPALQKTVDPCVRKVLAQVRFPARSGGEAATRSFTLQFRSQ
jgi:outer membrane biosynthesis protein TonB